MHTPLQIEVWSDIACPWCYVGKRRLEAALALFPQRERVALTWRSFQLDPSAPAQRDTREPYAQRLATKYGTSLQQAESMIQRLVDTAAADGVAMDFTRIRPGNTLNAHRLLQLAKARGLQLALTERFMRSYLCEGGAIGDPQHLLSLAVEVGLDADEASALLQGDAYTEDVRADQREARALGIDGVPFFLLNRRYGVSGAQPAELLLSALHKLLEEAAEPAAEAGATCGPAGCD